MCLAAFKEFMQLLASELLSRQNVRFTYYLPASVLLPVSS